MNKSDKEITVKGYLDEISEEYEHDLQWLLSKKPHLKQEAQNLVNKLNASIRVAIQNIELLKKCINDK